MFMASLRLLSLFFINLNTFYQVRDQSKVVEFTYYWYYFVEKFRTSSITTKVHDGRCIIFTLLVPVIQINRYSDAK